MYQMTDAAFAEAQRSSIASITTLSSRTAARRMGFILASCQATPSSSRRCFWTATSRQSSRTGQKGRPASSRSRNSPR